jgi:hypothetical protein
MIDIGEVTTALVAKLTTEMEAYGALVGDGVAPPKGGWPEGVPNTKSVFAPYVVVKYAGSIASLVQNTPLCSTYAARYDVGYSLVAYDNGRLLADTLAQNAREALDAIGTVYGSEVYGDVTVKFDRIYIDSLAGATRDDSTYPKMWSSATNFHLDVARKPQQ